MIVFPCDGAGMFVYAVLQLLQVYTKVWENILFCFPGIDKCAHQPVFFYGYLKAVDTVTSLKAVVW